MTQDPAPHGPESAGPSDRRKKMLHALQSMSDLKSLPPAGWRRDRRYRQGVGMMMTGVLLAVAGLYVSPHLSENWPFLGLAAVIALAGRLRISSSEPG